MLQNSKVILPPFSGADYTGLAGNVWKTDYAPDSANPTGITATDPLGRLWTTSLDSAGNVTSTRDPLNHGPNLSWGGSTGRELLSLSDATGVGMSFGYTSTGGRLTSVTDNAGVQRLSVAYNAYGQPQTVQNPVNGTSAALGYDATTGDLMQVSDGAGSKWLAGVFDVGTRTIGAGTAYDALGDLLSFSRFPDTGDPATSVTPLVTRVQYDAAQMPVRIANPVGVSQWSDFSANKLTGFRVTDPFGALLSQLNLSTDSRGRIYAITDRAGSLMQRRFDRTGNITQLLDGRGNITRFTYGPNNEPTGIVWSDQGGYGAMSASRPASGGVSVAGAVPPGGGGTGGGGTGGGGTVYNGTGNASILYDAVGRVRQITDERGIVYQYQYDNADRLIRVYLPSYAGQEYNFTYDDAGRMLGMTGPTGSATFQYDGVRKRLQQVTTNLAAQTGVPAFGYGVGYDYRTDGQVQTVTAPTGITQIGYDGAARPSSLTNGLGETSSWTYDGIGRVKSQTTVAPGTTLSTSYTYGATGQASDTSNAPLFVRGINNAVGGSVQQNFVRTYSYLGQLTRQDETGGGASVSQQFGYDLRGRLSQSQIAGQSATYAYDLSNNLQGGSGWTYNALNQVTSAPVGTSANLAGMSSPTYDTGGHLIGANGTTLRWNVWGQLDRIDVPSGGTTTIVNFVYDVLGRRAVKLVNGTLATRYLYSGSTLIGEADANGNVTRRYTWGLQGLISDAGTSAAGSRFYQYDGSANVRALIGGNGQVVWRGAWGPWGSVASGGAPPTPFGWGARGGGYTDAETGLVLLGARFYAPSVGRFVSRDPSGFTSGVNVYAYCMGDPINFYDSNGLWSEYSQEGYANGFKSFVDFLRPKNALQAIAMELGHSPALMIIGLYDAYDDCGTQTGFAGTSKGNPTRLWLSRANVAFQTGAAAMTIADGLGCNGLGVTGTCFAPGTKVQVVAKTASNGGGIVTAWKPIETMRKGDLLPVRDLKTGKLVVRRVKQVFKRTSDHVISVGLADRSGKIVETLKTTRQHPFCVSGKGFVPAGGLAVGNAIVTRAGPTLTVKSIKWLRRAEGYTVYNFEVEPANDKEDTHNYFVGTAHGGVLVHNGPQDCLRAAEAAAEAVAAKNLPSKVRPTMAAAYETTSGRTTTGVSRFQGPNPQWLQELLDGVPERLRSPTHGRCAEVDSLRQLTLDEAVGGTSRAVRISGSEEFACDSCRELLKALTANFK